MVRPKNKYEGIVWDMLLNKELLPLCNGYPDIIVEIEEHHIVACIEVKALDIQVLRDEQTEMMELLHKYGFECYRWTPASGLIPLFIDDRNLLLQLLKDAPLVPNLTLSPLLDWIDKTTDTVLERGVAPLSIFLGNKKAPHLENNSPSGEYYSKRLLSGLFAILMRLIRLIINLRVIGQFHILHHSKYHNQLRCR